MPIPSALAVVLLAFGCMGADPRMRTAQDAIAVLPASSDRLICLGDLDGDGTPEVAMRRVVDFHPRFDAVSVCDSRVVRVLWDPGTRWDWRRPPEWDTGHDLDGDGSIDFVVGLPSLEIGPDGAGSVLWVSGSSGEERFLALGRESMRGLGASLAMAGDLDGDGRCDLVAGAVPMAPFADDERRGLVVGLSGADGRVLWEVRGRRRHQEFGRSLAVPGDLDCDGFAEVVVQGGPDPLEKAAVLSGAGGARIATLSYDVNPVRAAGDTDGDGTADLVFDGRWMEDVHVDLDGTLVSGATLRSAGSVQLPGLWPEWGTLVALGDLDGDGFDELGMSASNHAGAASALDAAEAGALDLRELTFAALHAAERGPTRVVEHEGCVWISSGRTRELLWTCVGRPGLREELGRGLCSIPDVSGDGWPDLVVTGREATYVFAGPGRRSD